METAEKPDIVRADQVFWRFFEMLETNETDRLPITEASYFVFRKVLRERDTYQPDKRRIHIQNIEILQRVFKNNTCTYNVEITVGKKTKTDKITLICLSDSWRFVFSDQHLPLLRHLIFDAEAEFVLKPGIAEQPDYPAEAEQKYGNRSRYSIEE